LSGSCYCCITPDNTVAVVADLSSWPLFAYIIIIYYPSSRYYYLKIHCHVYMYIFIHITVTAPMDIDTERETEREREKESKETWTPTPTTTVRSRLDPGQHVYISYKHTTTADENLMKRIQAAAVGTTARGNSGYNHDVTPMLHIIAATATDHSTKLIHSYRFIWLIQWGWRGVRERKWSEGNE
jgi:hypothetical protein